MKKTQKERILYLSLKEHWFKLELAGIKKFDVREKAPRIKSLLFNKDNTKKSFDYVFFRHGYSSVMPFFKAKYSHFVDMEKVIVYPEIDRTLTLGIPFYNIAFSEIVEYGHINRICSQVEPVEIVGSHTGLKVLPLQNLDWFQRPLFENYLRSINFDSPVTINNSICVDYSIYTTWFNKASGVINYKNL